MWPIAIRYDIFYTVKELSRNLTAPTHFDLAKLKHLLRYLRGTLSLVTVLRAHLQFALGSSLDINAFADSDWAGCQKTRKSTSGTVIQILGCTVVALSRTQQTLALSSGEAELYAVGASILESLHTRNFVLEAGFAKTCPILVHTDSSAAKSMATRFGTTRRTRHIDLRLLYLQHLVNSGTIRIIKIPGDQNTSEVLTKYVTADTLRRHLEKLGLAGAKEHWDGVD